MDRNDFEWYGLKYIFLCVEEGKEMQREGLVFLAGVVCVRPLSVVLASVYNLEINLGILQLEPVEVDCHDTVEVNGMN
jgi:hypothetical protein